jgi:hypothetical protein
MARMRASSGGLQPAPAGNETPTFSADVPVGHRAAFDIDVIEILPGGVPAERLRLLRQRSADCHALCVPFSELQDASVARQEAEQRLARLQAPAQQSGFSLKDTDPRVVTAKKAVAKLTDDARRLQERSDQRAQAWQICARALQAAESWLKTGRPSGTVLEAVEVELPKPARGESGLLDAIENRRRRVRELRADAHRIRSTCYPSSFCKAKLRTEIEQLSMRGQIDVSGLVEHGDKINWPQTTLRSQVFNAASAVAFCETPDVLAVFAFVFKDQLLKRLDQEIDASADDANAMTPEAREQAESEILGDLIEIERQEAELVFRAQAQGIQIEHRGDISPQSLLSVRLLTALRAAPAGDSTLEHIFSVIMPGG